MKAFNWKHLFAHHPIFSDLDEEETERLLSESVSRERRIEGKKVIIHEGEEGDSLFVIGAGSVTVQMGYEESGALRLATLPAGEVFGEMALLDRKSRSATVTALEESTILEIDGAAIMAILGNHPKALMKLALKLSERLRKITDEIVQGKINSLHKELEAHVTRVDHDMDLVRASVKSTEITLDSVNRRASEISERATMLVQDTEKSIQRLFQAIRVIAIVGGIGAVVLGVFGYTTVDDVIEARDQVLDAEDAVKAIQPTLAKLSAYENVIEPRLYKRFLIDVALIEELANQDFTNAKETVLTVLDLNDVEVTDYLFENLFNKLIAKESMTQDSIQRLLEEVALHPRLTQRDQILLGYVLLAAYYITGPKSKFIETKENLEQLLDRYMGGPIKDALEVEISPTAFEDYFRWQLIQARIDASKKAGVKTDRGAGENMLLDPVIQATAEKRAKPLREVWQKIP